MATFHGHLPAYSGVPKQLTEIFTEQLTHSFTVNSITDKDHQQAILLSTCRTATYKLLKTLVAPAALTMKTFKELVALVQDHHTPKLSIIMRHFRFNTCVRQQGKSIANFVARLHDLASHCEYSDSAKELIRDHLICSICDDILQRNLLAVAELTFEKTFEKALLHESMARNCHMLNAPELPTANVHRTSSSTHTSVAPHPTPSGS